MSRVTVTISPGFANSGLAVPPLTSILNRPVSAEAITSASSMPLVGSTGSSSSSSLSIGTSTKSAYVSATG